MAIDGTYEIEIETPMGSQEVKLTFKTDGKVLSGSSESLLGQHDFTGTVDGNEVTWKTETSSPMGKMELTFTGKVTGNDFSGEVETGMFGTHPFKGKRV